MKNRFIKRTNQLFPFISLFPPISIFLFISLFLSISISVHSQNLDSLRQIVRTMNFEVPVLTPIPSSVAGTKTAKISELNGTWKFNPDNQDVSKAKNIQVPGEWEMQGFKVPKGQTATYWKSFTIPEGWKGNRIKIRFYGVSSFGVVKVNGKTVGTHEGSFVAFEFDITDAVKIGENTLEVDVQCETISDQLACTSQYAAHPIGGILRKVLLFTVPANHISDFSWSVQFDKLYKDAALNIKSKIDFGNNNLKQASLNFELVDPKGKTVPLEKSSFEVTVGQGSGEMNCSIQVKSPQKWDPEHPNLYILKTSLVVDGRVLQSNNQKIGFRQVEIRGNQLFINNNPTKLRGVNRHEVHPLTGRSLNPALCRKDVELFRAGNCNYIRTSHYPPSEEFLEACDELGMFVESESSLCWIEHGASPIWKTWNYLDSKYLSFMVRANMENLLAGRQHPCIIIWSLGNESRWSPLWERVLSEVKKLDTSRPTSFHDQCWGNYNNAKSSADVSNYHYPGLNGPAECEKEKARPTLFGEYMHVQCYARRELETDPSVRSDAWANTLKQMVDSVYRYPACLGGAIWSGVDDIFHLSENQICGYGPWGPIDGWRREKPEYTGMKKSYSPVIITNLESAKVVNGKLKLEIENRYNSLNINDLKIEAKMGSQVFKVNANIAPLSKGAAVLDMVGAAKSGFLKLTFNDPRGFVCQEEIIQIGEKPVPIGSKIKVNLVLNETANSFMIQSGKLVFTVNKSDGSFGCISPSGDSYITNGGKMTLIPFNGDDGGAPGIAANNYTQDIKPLDYNLNEILKVNSISAVQNPEGSVRVVIKGNFENKLDGSQEFEFNTDGSFSVSYDFRALVDFTSKNLLRQFGMLLTLPRSFDELTWDRKGLWTVYPGNDINRLNGTAKALPVDLKYVEVPQQVPAGDWKDFANKLGSNDFRSTKDHIFKASLKNNQNSEIIVQSDGSQSARSWVDGNQIRFLIAGLNGPGSCHFFTGPRPEIKKGEHLTGNFRMEFLSGSLNK